jgi:hypothetical protein
VLSLFPGLHDTGFDVAPENVALERRISASMLAHRALRGSSLAAHITIRVKNCARVVLAVRRDTQKGRDARLQQMPTLIVMHIEIVSGIRRGELKLFCAKRWNISSTAILRPAAVAATRLRY